MGGSGRISSHIWSILRSYSSISYELCIFRKYHQIVSIGSHKTVNVIGFGLPKWIGNHTFVSDNGAKCVSGIRRTSEIEFLCGASDKILYVEETKQCFYRIKFETPSRC